MCVQKKIGRRRKQMRKIHFISLASNEGKSPIMQKAEEREHYPESTESYKHICAISTISNSIENLSHFFLFFNFES